MSDFSFSHALAAGTGGFIGTVLRYGAGVGLAPLAARSGFPFATLTVNLLGCFAIGLAAAWLSLRAVPAPELRSFLVVGVLGGFTTYSSFANETLLLVRSGAMVTAFFNVSVHIVAGLGAAWAGYSLIKS